MLLGACLAGVPLLGHVGIAAVGARNGPARSPNSCRRREGPTSPKNTRRSYPPAARSSAPSLPRWSRLAGPAHYVCHALCRIVRVARLFVPRNDAFGAKLLASVFVAGGITAAFYGWFPLYLPELFPTSIRATAQGFAYNFGRVISAIGTLQTAALTAYFAQGIAADRRDIEAFPKAGATLAAIYLIGLFIIWLGPETKGKPLPE